MARSPSGSRGRTDGYGDLGWSSSYDELHELLDHDHGQRETDADQPLVEAEPSGVEDTLRNVER
jgi:hypothetical protein